MRASASRVGVGACALLLFALGSFSCGDPDTSGRLIPCETEDDCEYPLPMCDPQARVCVGCIASQQTCGAEQMCDEATRTCVPADPDAPCRFDADCPRPGFDTTDQIFCDLEEGRCVGCLDDLDCVSPEVCIAETRLCGTVCETCDAGVGDAGAADAGAADAGAGDAGVADGG